MNIINVVHYLNHLHVIHLSEQIFKARGHRGSRSTVNTKVAAVHVYHYVLLRWRVPFRMNINEASSFW